MAPMQTSFERPKRRCQVGLSDHDSGNIKKCHGLPTFGTDYFAKLPKDIVLSILCILAASASSPSDLLSITSTCKRLCVLGLDSRVLSKASVRSVAVRAKSWTECTHRFLMRCADAGNLEACYILGMIRFYCLQSWESGVALMMMAAKGSHPEALYSLAVIQLNGSGRLVKTTKDLADGVNIAARAGNFGHVGALWELSQCFRYGYGVQRNRTLVMYYYMRFNYEAIVAALGMPALASLFCTRVLLLLPEPHPANRFLVEWFEAGRAEVGEGLRLCSFKWCGRVETRPNEFGHCSGCWKARYCTTWCQKLGWRAGGHYAECVRMEPRGDAGDAQPVEGHGG